MRSAISCLTAVALVILPLSLHGQLDKINALSVEAGTRARIIETAPHSRFKLITVASITPDSLRYSVTGSSGIESIGWQQIAKMDASAGPHRHVGRGLAIGLLTGALAGIGLGAAGQHGEQRALNELGGAIGGAFFGTIIGGAAGFFWRTEKWNQVYLPRRGITVNSSR